MGTCEILPHDLILIVLRSQPLHLSPFTLDEYEHALRHSVRDPPCLLLAEIHSVLIYNLRTVPFTKHSAVLGLIEDKEMLSRYRDFDHSEDIKELDDVMDAMADIGNNWERVPLKHSDGRIGWEEALVGCLKDVGFPASFVRVHFLTPITQL